MMQRRYQSNAWLFRCLRTKRVEAVGHSHLLSCESLTTSCPRCFIRLDVKPVRHRLWGCQDCTWSLLSGILLLSLLRLPSVATLLALSPSCKDQGITIIYTAHEACTYTIQAGGFKQCNTCISCRTHTCARRASISTCLMTQEAAGIVRCRWHTAGRVSLCCCSKIHSFSR